MDVVGVDLTGKYEGSSKYNYMVTVTDLFSKYMWAMRMKTAETTEVIENLKTIFASTGRPLKIVTDNGRQFVSTEFSNYCERIGTDHAFVPRYCPWFAGFYERSHGNLHAAL